MTRDANAYGTQTAVAARTRAWLGGQDTFNSTTHPTQTELEGYFNQVSGLLNLALANAGFSIPVAQADAKRACDEWVDTHVVNLVEVSQPTISFGEEPNLRAQMQSQLFGGILAEATVFIEKNLQGFVNLGVARSSKKYTGLRFTGDTPHEDRADPTNTGREQPLFRRRQFDN